MEVELIIFVKSFFEAINKRSERVLEEGSIQGLGFFFFFRKVFLCYYELCEWMVGEINAVVASKRCDIVGCHGYF